MKHADCKKHDSTRFESLLTEDNKQLLDRFCGMSTCLTNIRSGFQRGRVELQSFALNPKA